MDGDSSTETIQATETSHQQQHRCDERLCSNMLCSMCLSRIDINVVLIFNANNVYRYTNIHTFMSIRICAGLGLCATRQKYLLICVRVYTYLQIALK